MLAAFILLALGALIGFALGMLFSWFAVAASSIGLAILSAAVLQVTGFGALSGIGIIVACLTVHQLAYGMGLVLANRRSERVTGASRKDCRSEGLTQLTLSS
jgi:hypothetical protein